MGDDVPVRSALRLGISIGAAIVAAWFVLGWVQARDAGRAQALISSQPLSRQSARQASSLLDSAAELNPDRNIDILRAQLADERHNSALAVRIMEGVTRAEPMNIEAWRELGVVATHNHQPNLAQTAFVHVLHLFGDQR
jgi:Flp pilus assembly protein TadD